MKNQNVFKRYEIKYMLTEDQAKLLLEVMEPRMKLDKFGRSTIRNIYYDTPDFILARHSIAKPEFKEKLRVRSYEQTTDDSKVFVELKRKFDSVVYKRRVTASNREVAMWLEECAIGADNNESATESDWHRIQLGKEIEYFICYYENLRPAVFLSYDREAYRMKADGDEFRVTFDRNVIYRDYDINLNSAVYGTRLLESGIVLMELKCPGGIPMWMVKILSELKIYKTSFSKYGTAYIDMKEKEKSENEYTYRKHIRYADGNINHCGAIRNDFGRGTRARTSNSTRVHA